MVLAVSEHDASPSHVLGMFHESRSSHLYCTFTDVIVRLFLPPIYTVAHSQERAAGVRESFLLNFVKMRQIVRSTLSFVNKFKRIKPMILLRDFRPLGFRLGGDCVGGETYIFSGNLFIPPLLSLTVSVRISRSNICDDINWCRRGLDARK